MTIRYASYEDFVLGNKIIEQPKVVELCTYDEFVEFANDLEQQQAVVTYDDLIEDELKALEEGWCEECSSFATEDSECDCILSVAEFIERTEG